MKRRNTYLSGPGRSFLLNSFDVLKMLKTTINTSKLQPLTFTIIITLIYSISFDPFSFVASSTLACLRSRVCWHLQLPQTGRPDSSFPPFWGLHSRCRPASLRSSTINEYFLSTSFCKVLPPLLATTEIV